LGLQERPRQKMEQLQVPTLNDLAPSKSSVELREKLVVAREKSPNCRPRASSLEPGTFYSCSECKYMTTSKNRYDRHFKQPRHVNSYRDRAYKDPKKRQVWLKVWFSQLEAAELENYEAFELTEEHDEDVIDQDMIFRMPTAEEIAAACQINQAADRKISSSSTWSNTSFRSDISTVYE